MTKQLADILIQYFITKKKKSTSMTNYVCMVCFPLERHIEQTRPTGGNIHNSSKVQICYINNTKYQIRNVLPRTHKLFNLSYLKNFILFSTIL